MQAYANASFLVGERYQDTEDLDGLFSGYDPHTASYDPASWSYEGVAAQGASGTQTKEQSAPYQHGAGGPVVEGGAGQIATDPALRHPRCVFQILKRHFARYTPEMVEQICGVPEDRFLDVCQAWTGNSGRDRTTALVYSVGWTQHTMGAQFIRAGAIIQLQLGNIGRPGGGVYALRGHASIQGSTDIPTLFKRAVWTYGAFFLLLDEPEAYGLPPDPVVPTRDLASSWGHAAAALLATSVSVFLGRRRP